MDLTNLPIGFFQDCNPESKLQRHQLVKKINKTDINEDNILEKIFYSEDNIDLINKQIVLSIWKKTNNTYKVNFQDKNQILIIMQYVFLEYEKHLPYNITNQINSSNQKINELENIDFNNFEGEERRNKELETSREIDRENEKIRKLQPQLNNISFDNNSLKQGLSRIDLSLQPKLEEYERGLALNKQQLLQQYDPTRLSRIQALQQLAGTTQFNQLLSGGIQ